MFTQSSVPLRWARLAVSALSISSLLFWSVNGPPAPTRADELTGNPADPVTQLEVTLDLVHIFDDHSLIGPGDFQAEATVEVCHGPSGTLCNTVSSNQTGTFSSDDGDETADVLLNLPLKEFPGIPIREGDSLKFNMFMLSVSSFPVDTATVVGGHISEMFSEQEHWGLGTHSALAPEGDYYANYTVRVADLPDVTTADIDGETLKLLTLPDGDVIPCIGVWNAGRAEIAGFDTEFFLDSTVPFAYGEPAHLGAGGTGFVCSAAPIAIPPGSHEIAVELDRHKLVAELNERNNYYKQIISLSAPLNVASGAIIASTPTPTPSASRADLVIDSIRVKGKDPSGQNDCDPGKNDVTVATKNQGQAAAGPFAVRLVVDNQQNDADEQKVDGLDAGKTRDVAFDNVKLDEGDHMLAATADAARAVQESKDDNNSKSVTVTCKDAGEK